MFLGATNCRKVWVEKSGDERGSFDDVRVCLRSGLEFNDFIPFASFMPSYTEEVVGTIMVGAAQPFSVHAHVIVQPMVWEGRESVVDFDCD